MSAVTFKELPRRVYNISGSGQGNITIDSVVGTGLYFHTPFTQGDFFEYLLYALSTNKAEVGWGIIENLSQGLGVMSRNVDESSDGIGVALNLQAGQPYILGLKKSDRRSLSENPSTLKATRPELITRTVNVLDWDELQDQPLANTAVAQRFWVAQGRAQDDGNSGLWEWRPGSNAAPNNIAVDVTVTVIQSSVHPGNGRYHRVPMTPAVANFADVANIPLRAIGFDATGGDKVKLNHPVRGLMNVAVVARFPVGVYPTIDLWKAEASAKWNEGDEFLIFGKSQYGDCVPFSIVWDDDNTNTTALDFTHYRPADVAGANQGRAVRTEPAMTATFADALATPSFKGSNEWKIAATPPPGGYTEFKDILEGETYTLWPHTTKHALLKGAIGSLPPSVLAGGDYYFGPGDGHLIVKKRGGIVRVSATHQERRGALGPFAGTGVATIDVASRISPNRKPLVLINGGVQDPAALTTITPDTPADGSTRLTFGFNIAATDSVVLHD